MQYAQVRVNVKRHYESVATFLIFKKAYILIGIVTIKSNWTGQYARPESTSVLGKVHPCTGTEALYRTYGS